MILPGMGVISEVIACFSRKRIFGYTFVAFSSLAIAVIGFLVWGHHMFVSGQSVFAGVVFSFITFLVAVPSAIKTFNWTATLYKGEISFEAPMIYAFGFIGLFLIGGLTGLFLGSMGPDVHFHDTYFVVAHFHYVMVGGMVMAFLCGLHFWWPKMVGRMYNEFLARISALAVFFGFNFTFMPQFVLGYLGMPRRYHIYAEEWQILNVMSTLGATVLGIGYLLPMIYLPWSILNGKPAGNNPWGAKGLEWETTSPPPTFNFDEDNMPVVTEEAYNYKIERNTLGGAH
jgi:cytochrome c oxidase subunit I